MALVLGITQQHIVLIASVLLIAIALIGAAAEYREAHAGADSKPVHNSQSAESSASTSSTISNEGGSSLNSMSNADGGNSVSTNVTTTNNNGDVQTKATVNGQEVQVPENGTVEKQIGDTHVNISAGSASNVYSNSTSLNISTSTNSSNSSGSQP